MGPGTQKLQEENFDLRECAGRLLRSLPMIPPPGIHILCNSLSPDCGVGDL